MLTFLYVSTPVAFGFGEVVQFKKANFRCQRMLTAQREDHVSLYHNVVVPIARYEKLPSKRLSYQDFIKYNKGDLNNIYVFSPNQTHQNVPSFGLRERGKWVRLSNSRIGIRESGYYLMVGRSFDPVEIGYRELSQLSERVFTRLEFGSEVVLVKEILDVLNAIDERFHGIGLKPFEFDEVMKRTGSRGQILSLMKSWDVQYSGQIAVSRKAVEILKRPHFDFLNLRMRSEFFEGVMSEVHKHYGKIPEADNAIWSLMDRIERFL